MKQLKYETKRKFHGFVFILPWLIGFIMFFAVPLVNTVVYSFNEVSVREQGGMNLEYSGIQNYIDLFQKEVTTANEQVLRLLVEENQQMIINVPLIVIFSLFLALIINAKFPGRGVVRVIFFLPIILGLDIVMSMMQLDTGMMGQAAATTSAFADASIAESILKFTGLPAEAIIFIKDIINNIFTLITQSGVQTLILLAGLQSITPSMYEVAKIEGATSYETFWKVTIPAIANIIFFASIYTLIDVFLRSPITKEIHQFAFLKSKIGVGSALSVIFILNAVVLLGLISWFLKKVVKLDYGK
ncbi:MULTISPECIES: sugar ABC transporter permease [Zhenhengia]|jgi:ABC-type sugar transport system permease subunit|uniref:carbohydrate ABC transporter permease n=2 Tax=Lachnospiraceae TaxID=186803 RepID=UPI002910F4DD|nr:sugar ABC transporter permease [Zhenhengia yiwuensis]MDU6358837.1 sugar ABC transporter permease [Clostridiales bacterium]MDU7503162.1 sugar ABC transporter permease [Corynebacterium kroppenstedtii]MDY3366660.1 sugar ABC transporter permease [Zhenhengia yiwuensis]